MKLDLFGNQIFNDTIQKKKKNASKYIETGTKVSFRFKNKKIRVAAYVGDIYNSGIVEFFLYATKDMKGKIEYPNKRGYYLFTLNEIELI